jgi:hypothetical protein
MRSWRSRERTISEEKGTIISPRKLRSLANGKRAHADSDLDTGRAIHTGNHVC